MATASTPPVVFIGGMPRSGTTALSALLSTSEKCNPFLPECHYIYYCADALARMLACHESSGKYFHPDRERATLRHIGWINDLLNEAFEAAGRPEILILKQCLLTPLFPLLARYFPTSKFILIYRDCRDVLSSVWDVRRRKLGADADLPPDTIASCINKYNFYYRSVIEASNQFDNRLFSMHYNQLINNNICELEEFLGIKDICFEMTWKRSGFDVDLLKDDPVYSSGWGKPIGDLERSRRLPKPVDDEVLAATHLTALKLSAFERRQQGVELAGARSG